PLTLGSGCDGSMLGEGPLTHQGQRNVMLGRVPLTLGSGSMLGEGPLPLGLGLRCQHLLAVRGLESSSQAAMATCMSPELPDWVMFARPGIVRRIGLPAEQIPGARVNSLLHEQVEEHAQAVVIRRGLNAVHEMERSNPSPETRLSSWRSPYTAEALAPPKPDFFRMTLLTTRGAVEEVLQEQAPSWMRAYDGCLAMLTMMRQVQIEVSEMHLLACVTGIEQLHRLIAKQTDAFIDSMHSCRDEQHARIIASVQGVAQELGLYSTEAGRAQLTRILRCAMVMMDEALMDALSNSLQRYKAMFDKPKMQCADALAGGLQLLPSRLHQMSAAHDSYLLIRVELRVGPSGAVFCEPPLAQLEELHTGVLNDLMDLVRAFPSVRLVEGEVKQGDANERQMLEGLIAGQVEEAKQFVQEVVVVARDVTLEAMASVSKHCYHHPENGNFNLEYHDTCPLTKFVREAEDTNCGFIEALETLDQAEAGIILLDCGKLIAQAKEHLAQRKETMYNSLLLFWQGACAKWRTVLEQNQAMVGVSLADINPAVFSELRDYVTSFDDEETGDGPRLNSGLRLLGDQLRVLEEGRVPVSDELLTDYFNTLQMLGDLQQKVAEIRPQLDATAQLVAQRVRKLEKELQAQVNDLVAQVDFDSYHEKANMEHAHDHSERLQQKLTQMLELADQVHDLAMQEELMGLDPETDIRQDLNDALHLMDPLTKTWTLAAAWQAQSTLWQTIQFQKLSAQKMRKQVLAAQTGAQHSPHWASLFEPTPATWQAGRAPPSSVRSSGARDEGRHDRNFKFLRANLNFVLLCASGERIGKVACTGHLTPGTGHLALDTGHWAPRHRAPGTWHWAPRHRALGTGQRALGTGNWRCTAPRHLALGHRALGTDPEAPGHWALGTWHLVPGTWYWAPGTGHLILGTGQWAPGIWQWALGTGHGTGHSWQSHLHWALRHLHRALGTSDIGHQGTGHWALDT
ncbi:hypothetical protein CYMTET_22445, partial [Cymbomonas tetramitiformis]